MQLTPPAPLTQEQIDFELEWLSKVRKAIDKRDLVEWQQHLKDDATYIIHHPQKLVFVGKEKIAAGVSSFWHMVAKIEHVWVGGCCFVYGTAKLDGPVSDPSIYINVRENYIEQKSRLDAIVRGDEHLQDPPVITLQGHQIFRKSIGTNESKADAIEIFTNVDGIYARFVEIAMGDSTEIDKETPNTEDIHIGSPPRRKASVKKGFRILHSGKA